MYTITIVNIDFPLKSLSQINNTGLFNITMEDICLEDQHHFVEYYYYWGYTVYN